MKSPRYARNRVEAARLACISRTAFYQLSRLPDFPAPKVDGRWDVAKIKKFALAQATRIKGPLEKDKLQMQLLDLKIRRASQELADFERTLRADIEAEV